MRSDGGGAPDGATWRNGPAAGATGALLLTVLLVSYAYFYQGGGWNQNSRYALVRALTEAGTIRIDAYHQATGDKIEVDGHFYSDKAPGQAFTALVPVAVSRPLLRVAGVDPDGRVGIALLSYLATVLTASVPMALAAWLIHRLALVLGSTREAGLFAALALGLATPAWAYGTLLMGHSLAAAALALSFTAAVLLGGEVSARRRWRLGLGVGAAAGWATLTEYPAGTASCLLALFAAYQVWPYGLRAVTRVAGAVATGAAGFAATICAYHYAIFGTPFETPITHLHHFPQIARQPFTWPTTEIVTMLLVGGTRGIFRLAPVLAAAPIGFVLAWRRGGPGTRARRAALAVALLLFVHYLLFNAAYVHPSGGSIYGPRYLLPGFTFLALGVAFAYEHAGRLARAGLIALALYGATLSLLAVSTHVQPSERIPRPVSEVFWPKFRAGEISAFRFSFTGPVRPPLPEARVAQGAWNLGQLAGLEGRASLLPLGVIWGALGALAWRAAIRRRRRRP